MKTGIFFMILLVLLIGSDLPAQQLYKITRKFNHPSYHVNNYKHPNKAAETSYINGKWHPLTHKSENESSDPSADYYKMPEPQAVQRVTLGVQRLHTTSPFVNNNHYKSQFRGKQAGKKPYVRKQEDFLVEGDFPETHHEQ